MLLKNTLLEAIRDGQVDLVFRSWKRPTVKTGGTLKTVVGVLQIEEVKEVTSRQITTADALRAGYSSRAELLKELSQREGTYFRITVRYGGADPRLALRESDDLTPYELEQIAEKLARLDRASQQGAWTHTVLAAINRHPNLIATKLSNIVGFERDWLKTNIRKLKNLGLTISKRYQAGYEISPRGKKVLAFLDEFR